MNISHVEACDRPGCLGTVSMKGIFKKAPKCFKCGKPGWPSDKPTSQPPQPQ